MPNQKEPELTPVEREGYTEEEIQTARQEFAELIVDTMEMLIKSGEWDPREGVVGLERALLKQQRELLNRDPKRHDSPSTDAAPPRS